MLLVFAIALGFVAGAIESRLPSPRKRVQIPVTLLLLSTMVTLLLSPMVFMRVRDSYRDMPQSVQGDPQIFAAVIVDSLLVFCILLAISMPVSLFTLWASRKQRQKQKAIPAKDEFI